MDKRTTSSKGSLPRIDVRSSKPQSQRRGRRRPGVAAGGGQPWIARVLRYIIGDEERFRRAYQLILLIMAFLLACLIVVAVVLIWRGAELGQVVQVVVARLVAGDGRR